MHSCFDKIGLSHFKCRSPIEKKALYHMRPDYSENYLRFSYSIILGKL